ncbi:vanadium-dependent haloperoxidase [Sphingomonas arenae]|uniref:vanadium-dependent haloperoxidase n=1 Tax=Sphingomonas arenae TaxID=2812555 RepID=UPI001967A7E0|nr:vanadium-dependent haloperoxidase [Sphingomonas arenae]
MRHLLLFTASAFLFTGSASADTVCEWMDFADKIEKAAAPPPDVPIGPEHAHAQAQVALAMFEALNAIDRRYEPYLKLPAGDPKASQDAAATTAAYKILLDHYPGQKSALEESYTIAMDAIADSPAKVAGKSLGERAAAAALKAGLIDPAVTQQPYRPVAPAGVWVPTTLPVFQPWSTAFKPWFIGSANAFRPAPPPPVTSKRYAHDLAEVQRLGGKVSKERSAHQTLMARYRITPDMMPALRLIADQKGRRAVDNARLFALYQMIGDDAGMAMADAKLHYNYWRPITAIRNAAEDGNPATQADPSWEPLIRTPNHPEYPCGHCIFAGATAELMKSVDADSPAWGVRVASRSIPTAAIQVLPSWDKWAEEVNLSRTLGGVHYRFSNEAGEDMGRKITRQALATIMRPLPGTR